MLLPRAAMPLRKKSINNLKWRRSNGSTMKPVIPKVTKLSMNKNQKSDVRPRDTTAKGGGDEWLHKMILISPKELPPVARSPQQQQAVDNPSRMKTTKQEQDKKSFRDHACLQLTLSAIPERWALFYVHEEDLFDLQISFCREYKKRVDEEKQANSTSAEIYKQVMDKICEEFAVRADQVLFQNRSGTFLRKCPLYRKPTRVFDHQLTKYREQFKSSEQI